MSFIAVIPARSGSKGVQHKNVVELNGEPLLVHSVK
jgi:CMP-N-acetylneuraminic acid synthetase